MAGIERSVLSEGVMNVSAGYQSSHLGKTYQGREQVVDPLDREADVQLWKAEFEYGLGNRVSLLFNLSYATRSRELTALDAQTRASERITFQGSGFADPILFMKYQVVQPTFLSPLGVTVGSGAKIPMGNYRLMNQGTRLPIDLQPGNGAIDLLNWFFVQHKIQELALGFNVHGMYRYSSINFDGYRFGDEMTASAGVSYALSEYLAFVATVRGRLSKPDYSNKRILDGTGGTSWYVEPQLFYFEENTTFRLFSQVPFYQNVRGNQLTISNVIGLELMFSLGLEDNVGSGFRSEE